MELNDAITDIDDQKFVLIVIKRLENNLGVSLNNVFKESNDASVIRNEMHKIIHSYIMKKAPNSLNVIDMHQFVSNLEGDNEFNVIPPIGVTEENYIKIQQFTNSEIDNYVKRVTNGLSLIKEGMTINEVAYNLLMSGIATLGIAMATATFEGLCTGMTITSSIVFGLGAMSGIGTIIAIASIIITELLIYLIFQNEKSFVGMIFNNTDLCLNVSNWRKGVNGGNNSDLYMNTGKMVGFMETNKDVKLSSPLVQIPARLFIKPNDADNIVLGGIFAAQKNYGFFGTEGIMLLRPDNNINLGFYFLFACPYAMLNGINVYISSSKYSPRDLFQEMYNGRSLDKTFTSNVYNGFIFHARCVSKTGGKAVGIAFLNKLD